MPYWRRFIGVDVLPANSREKKPLFAWRRYQTKPSTDKEFQYRLDHDEFRNGLCIITDKVRHRPDRQHLFYVEIDGDKADGVKELLRRNGHIPTIQEVSEKWIVQQHKDNPEKAHFGFYSPIRFPEKWPDPILGLEVRCEDNEGKTGRVIMVSPSIHEKGQPYEIIGTKDPAVLTELQAQELIQHIDQICIRNGVEYLTSTKTVGSGKLNSRLKLMCKRLIIDKSIEIREGQRSDMLIAIADSILLRHSTKRSEDKLREFFEQVNEQLCYPPLDDKEIGGIWQRACNFTERIREEQRQADDTNRNTSYGDGSSSDYLPSDISEQVGDNIYLKINDSPIILVIAHKQSGRIVLARVYERTEGEGPSKFISHVLSIKNTIIDAIIIKVVINENPIDGVKTYQITLNARKSRKEIDCPSCKATLDLGDTQETKTLEDPNKDNAAKSELYLWNTPEPANPWDKKPVELKGSFAAMAKKGIHFTSYNEYDGAGRPISQWKREEDEE